MTFNGNGNLTGSAQYFNDKVFYNGVATQSLRFDKASSAFLSRTPSSASNRKTWTFSTWLKIASDDGSPIILSAGTGGGEYMNMFINDSTSIIDVRVIVSSDKIKIKYQQGF